MLSESTRRIRNGARYHVNASGKKKKLSRIPKSYERENRSRSAIERRAKREKKRQGESCDHRAIHYLCHPVFRSQCGSTKSKCIAYANAGRAPVVSAGVNSQSASGNNHNDQ